MAAIRDFEESLRGDGSNGLTINLCVDLYSALKELWEVSGEATIPLTSVQNVRKMSKLIGARQRAEDVIDRAELKGWSK